MVGGTTITFKENLTTKMTKLLFLNFALLCVLGILTTTSHSFVVLGADLGVPGAFKMTTTSFSELDSCHYRVKEGCLTASGTIASDQTAACPRDWKGRKILVEGREYICEDFYNKDLSDRIDLWAGYGIESYEEAKRFGVKELSVVIK